MGLSQTHRSTRRLSEVARYYRPPLGTVTTAWPAVAKKCSEWGDEFDRWQDGLGMAMLAKRADGKYAATIGGITLSIPRQVAKTFLVGRTVFALCALNPGLRVLWTAHRTRTATNTFRSLAGFARRKKVKPSISGIRQTNGEQEIQFANGSVIMFGAREQGFGRGFDKVDIEVFDEAQILTIKALEDMVAATNQTTQAAGALLFYMGTPPRPTDPGEVFRDRRNDALAGNAPDALYVECSADPNIGRPGGPSLDDRGQWEIANPSYPDRTPEESMLRLRKNLRSDEAWRREGLGVWDSGTGVKALIDKGVWSSLVAVEIPSDGPVGVGIKFSADGRMVSLASARRPENGPTYVEALAERSMTDGFSWIVDVIVPSWRQFGAIVIDGKAGIGELRSRLVKAGVSTKTMKVISTDEAITAHAMVLAAVHEGTISHGNQPGLNASVASATKRLIGKSGGWGWKAIGDGDVTPLDAVTLAFYAASIAPRKRSGHSGWRVVTA